MQAGRSTPASVEKPGLYLNLAKFEHDGLAINSLILIHMEIPYDACTHARTHLLRHAGRSTGASAFLMSSRMHCRAHKNVSSVGMGEQLLRSHDMYNYSDECPGPR